MASLAPTTTTTTTRVDPLIEVIRRELTQNLGLSYQTLKRLQIRTGNRLGTVGESIFNAIPDDITTQFNKNDIEEDDWEKYNDKFQLQLVPIQFPVNPFSFNNLNPVARNNNGSLNKNNPKKRKQPTMFQNSQINNNQANNTPNRAPSRRLTTGSQSGSSNRSSSNKKTIKRQKPKGNRRF